MRLVKKAAAIAVASMMVMSMAGCGSQTGGATTGRDHGRQPLRPQQRQLARLQQRQRKRQLQRWLRFQELQWMFLTRRWASAFTSSMTTL